MNYADIRQYDVANGPGIRVSLFVSGCSHRCEGCFNPETWDFAYGEEFTDETADAILAYLKPAHVKGLTLLGGDPMERQNVQALLPLLKRVRRAYPGKDIWCFTGYDFERDVLGTWVDEPDVKEFLSYIDVLVDGPFVAAKKNINLRFKGSENQRTILVQESLRQKKTVLWDDKQD
ncbi:MAG: anaerobic ribonucleoside-triphosphate reductase activating protein [Christensenella sp.]|uniref:anaerobic ribonucleoside-triphosphate reductase activating protein n=1 Tax=Christensenella sp. TaxID=1935934 RepID=UPI002B212220|nr:anaerobic ribonucleoside-triphosphate reductase activating protein [Christensenella sp.]MEA5004387.1 anaerobic ribonucleoside-triphosphate reductase activating protein [Christensenella sp.]